MTFRKGGGTLACFIILSSMYEPILFSPIISFIYFSAIQTRISVGHNVA